jgi:DNA primase
VPDSTVDEIKRRLDIVDVIGQTVQLKRSGKSFMGLCPFHGEKSPSFYVSPERGSWRCFGCGEGGDIFSFVQRRDNLDFRDALRHLAERAGVPIEETHRPDPNAKQERDRLHAILESTALYYRGTLAGELGQPAREYIIGRGVTPESVDRFGLGYSDPQGRGLERHLTRAGYSIDECVKAGALGLHEDSGRVYDRFRDRVIFPIRDVDGRAIGFGGRAMRPDQQPKYLNSPQSEVFDKGANLYALDQARDTIRKQGQAIIVEGYMDALIPHQAGFTNVVATLGTALTERHVQVLRRQSAREIVLCLDADAAGLRAAVRGSGVAHDSTKDEAPRIDFAALNRSERSRGHDVGAAMFIERRTILKAFSVSGGKDPDELIREDPTQWARDVAGAQPIIDFVFDRLPRVFDLTATEGRRDAVRASVGLIYDMADPIDREQHLQRVSGIIGTGIDVLHEYMRRAMRVVPPSEPEAPAVPREVPLSSEDQLQELVLSLILRASSIEQWPEPADFANSLHRAILEQLQSGPAWPDVATALDRLEHALGDSVEAIVGRLRSHDAENERVMPDEILRELDVRRLELRKHRLFRQHQALDSALREGEALDAAERREYHERLSRLASSIGETIAEQQRLGVVGTASWSIRRGQEVLGG